MTRTYELLCEMLSRVYHVLRLQGRGLALITIAAVIVTCTLASGAFGANPIVDLAEHSGNTSGGIDPHGDSWQSIRNSLEQFLHLEFVLRLFLSLALAVACAWVIAWHPRSSRIESLSNFEERKTLVLLGMVGAVVAELSGVSATLAFVIFGIGALLRFRTVLDNPRLTIKAVTVVVIGLACGMGSWVMAVFVTIFTWALIYWLDSRLACRLRIRLGPDADPEVTFGTVQSLLVGRGCRLQSSTIYKGKRQLVFMLHIPAELDVKQLELDLRAKTEDARTDIEVL